MFALPYPLFVAAGILGGIAFLHPGLSWLMFVYALLLIHAMHRSHTWKDVAKGTLLAGFIKTLFSLSFFMDAYPASWLSDVSSLIQFFPFVLTLLLSAFFIGLGTLCAGLMTFFLQKKTIPKYLAFALFFLCADLLGALFFSLYAFAPGHPPNMHFGFSMVGYALADHGVLSTLAAWGGLTTLSLCLGACASLTYALYERHSRARGVLVGAVLLYLTTAYIPLSIETTSTPRTVASISTHYDALRTISPKETLRRQDNLMQAIQNAHAQGAELILLPESAGLTAYKNEFRVLYDLQKEVGSGIVVDVTNVTLLNGSSIQRSFTYDLDEGKVYVSDKSYTTPIGEYMPLGHYALGRLFGMEEIDMLAQRNRSQTQIPADTPSKIPTVLFCVESSSPFMALRKGAHRDTELVVHPVSHSWFRTPYTYWHQEAQALKVHARALRTPILQAANQGPSVLYMPDGSVREGTTTEVNKSVEVVLFTM